MEREDKDAPFEFERLEYEKDIAIQITRGVAYDMEFVIRSLVAEKDLSNESVEFEENLLEKFVKIVPEDLAFDGPEEYKGDLEVVEDIKITYVELKCLGNEVLLMPTGNQVASEIPGFKDIKVVFDGFRNRCLMSFLAVEEAFVQAGGKKNPFLKATVLNHLS